PADFEAVDPGHRDVEQNDVGVMLPHRVERGSAVVGTDDVVAIGEQQFPEERSNALGVVGDEHPASSRRRRGHFIQETRPKGTIGAMSSRLTAGTDVCSPWRSSWR